MPIEACPRSLSEQQKQHIQEETKALLQEAHPGNVYAASCRLASKWCTPEEVSCMIHTLVSEAMFEPERCETVADLLASLHDHLPATLPGKPGSKPRTIIRLLRDKCETEFNCWLHSIETTGVRAVRSSFVVTCTMEPGVIAPGDTGDMVRVRCRSLTGAELGTFAVQTARPFGEQLAVHIREKVGNSLAIRVTLVSESGHLIWQESDRPVMLAFIRLLGHLCLRVLPEQILRVMLLSLQDLSEATDLMAEPSEHLIKCALELLHVAGHRLGDWQSIRAYWLRRHTILMGQRLMASLGFAGF